MADQVSPNSPQKTKRKMSFTEDEIPDPDLAPTSFINLTTHNEGSEPIPVNWGESNPMERGPIIGFIDFLVYRWKILIDLTVLFYRFILCFPYLLY